MRTYRELLHAAAEYLDRYAQCGKEGTALALEILGYLDTPVVPVTNVYKEFYDLPEEQRIALIGSVLVEQNGPYTVMYFPIGLDDANSNYGKAQGLITVHSVYIDRENGAWFKAGAFSPDDLDIDLEFHGTECDLHDQVVQFMKEFHKHDTSYYGVLRAIQRRFNAGTL
jgi:hypothetical protein